MNGFRIILGAMVVFCTAQGAEQNKMMRFDSKQAIRNQFKGYVSSKGENVLHILASDRFTESDDLIEIAQMSVQDGAAVDLKTHEGKTPLDYARETSKNRFIEEVISNDFFSQLQQADTQNSNVFEPSADEIAQKKSRVKNIVKEQKDNSRVLSKINKQMSDDHMTLFVAQWRKNAIDWDNLPDHIKLTDGEYKFLYYRNVKGEADINEEDLLLERDRNPIRQKQKMDATAALEQTSGHKALPKKQSQQVRTFVAYPVLKVSTKNGTFDYEVTNHQASSVDMKVSTVLPVDDAGRQHLVVTIKRKRQQEFVDETPKESKKPRVTRSKSGGDKKPLSITW